MSGNEKNGVKSFELVAPDGGWGYMIAIGVVLSLGFTSMFVVNTSLIYNDFMVEIGMTTTHASLMYGLSAICFAISGFLVSPLLLIMGLRTVLLLGVIMFNVGVLGNIFANSIVTFIFSHAVFQGMGYGVIYNITTTLLNDYFVKKRLMIISLVQTVIGVLSMLVPIIFKWSMEGYGLRGSILLILGVTLHSFIGVALVQPVAWHMKKQEVSNTETKLPLLTNTNEKQSTPVIKLTDSVGSTKKTYDFELSVEEKDVHPLNNIINLLLDKELLKPFLMSCVSLGPSLAMFADTNYTFMLPQALYKIGWSSDNVALAISLLAFGDLAMRVVLALFSNLILKIGIQEIYLISIFVGLVTRLGMLWSKNPTVILVYITILGVSHCSIVVLIPMVIAEAVAPEKFTSAIGIFMVLSGVMNLILAPALGAVRDLTDSYGAVFYIISSCFAMIILFWSIELCYKRNKHKRLQRLEYLKQKKLIKK